MAAAAAQVTPDTLHRWKKNDLAFSKAVARAREAGAADLVATIKAAAVKDWRAAAFLLERIVPDQYGRRAVITGSNGGPVQIEGELRIAAGIRGNPEARTKLHAAIMAAAAGASK